MGPNGFALAHAVAIISNFWAYQYTNPDAITFESAEPLILDLPDAEIIYYSQFFDTAVFFAQLTRDILAAR
jgi:hypothetical protein